MISKSEMDKIDADKKRAKLTFESDKANTEQRNRDFIETEKISIVNKLDSYIRLKYCQAEKDFNIAYKIDRWSYDKFGSFKVSDETLLYLLRHGISELNKHGYAVCGSIDLFDETQPILNFLIEK